jgi:hypothetical protein
VRETDPPTQRADPRMAQASVPSLRSGLPSLTALLTQPVCVFASQPTWHCIVGSSFGSVFDYEPHKYLHFFIEKTGIILYKYG